MAKTMASRKWTATDVQTLVRMYAADHREHDDLGLQAIARKLGRSVHAVEKKLSRTVDGSDIEALEQLPGEYLSYLRRCCQRLKKPLPTALIDRIEDGHAALMDLVNIILARHLPAEMFREILTKARYAQVKTMVDAIRSV